MERIEMIVSADKAAYRQAKERWDSIAKPLGSFGALEKMVCQLAAVQSTADVRLDKRAVVVMCGDHGVVEEGVTQCGSEVTAVCADAIAEGRSNINAVARAVNAEVFAVDVGMTHDGKSEKLIRRRVADGTQNITHGTAMTVAQTRQAIAVGIDMAGLIKSGGFDVIVSGEMGIGNTTSAAAMTAAFTGLSPEMVTGRGAGLSDEGMKRKLKAVKKALEVNKKFLTEPFGVLQSLGGFEIAAMTGLFLGGAVYKIPVVIDGVTSLAAAAAAVGICQKSSEYVLPSHISGEPAARSLFEKIGMKPVIDAGLRLGEGTGGALLLPLLDGALALYRESHSFDEEKIERYVDHTKTVK